MGWQCVWSVTCEQCHKVGPSDHVQEKAEKRALSAGWIRGQCYGLALHLCPECARELPDWWPDSTGMNFHWEQA